LRCQELAVAKRTQGLRCSLRKHCSLSGELFVYRLMFGWQRVIAWCVAWRRCALLATRPFEWARWSTGVPTGGVVGWVGSLYMSQPVMATGLNRMRVNLADYRA
jgi:hypothetical protein